MLKKPLRPTWVTPDTTSTYESIPSTNYHDVICCTASRRVLGAEMTEDGYIQGAGDDSESWSNGLTPKLFWRHRERLLAADQGDISDLITRLIATDQDDGVSDSDAVKIGPTRLYIGTLSSVGQAQNYDAIVVCGGTVPFKSDQETKDAKGNATLYLPCGNGKLGSRALRSQLSHIPPFITSLPVCGLPPKILFMCPTGKDLSVGVMLVVLCLFFDDSCKQHQYPSFRSFDACALSSAPHLSADLYVHRPFQLACNP